MLMAFPAKLDALCHNIDSLLNKYKNLKSTEYAIESIKLMNNNLPKLLNRQVMIWLVLAIKIQLQV